MGFSVIPKSIGGINVNSALGPLAALFRNDKIDNLIFPSDLGSNPAMGHAVVFQVYDVTTDLRESGREVATVFNNATAQVGSALSAARRSAVSDGGDILGTFNNLASAASSLTSGLGRAGAESLDVLGNLYLAPSYRQRRDGPSLANISLFMPESIQVSYNSDYDDPSMTKMFGIHGLIGNAISDMSNVGIGSAITPYATAVGSRVASDLLPGLGQAAGAISQAFGVVSNPQIQLLFKGTRLREFQLEFILTPKSASEAEKVKQICDSFAFYSLPNIAGGQVGTSGQYLNPPQLFSVQFKFLGKNDLIGSVTSVISSALTNSGLGFFTSGSRITNGNEAKLFTVKDCVLTDVNVDYTPNGFATYNDGYPVQTRLTLSFKETQMITKEHFAGTSIAKNYEDKARIRDQLKTFGDF